MKTYFQQQITEKHLFPIGTDPRHVEAYIRVKHSTLNVLSWSEIRRECRIAVDCIKAGGVDAAERLARSFGL